MKIACVRSWLSLQKEERAGVWQEGSARQGSADVPCSSSFGFVFFCLKESFLCFCFHFCLFVLFFSVCFLHWELNPKPWKYWKKIFDQLGIRPASLSWSPAPFILFWWRAGNGNTQNVTESEQVNWMEGSSDIKRAAGIAFALKACREIVFQVYRWGNWGQAICPRSGRQQTAEADGEARARTVSYLTLSCTKGSAWFPSRS